MQLQTAIRRLEDALGEQPARWLRLVQGRAGPTTLELFEAAMEAPWLPWDDD